MSAPNSALISQRCRAASRADFPAGPVGGTTYRWLSFARPTTMTPISSSSPVRFGSTPTPMEMMSSGISQTRLFSMSRPGEQGAFERFEKDAVQLLLPDRGAFVAEFEFLEDKL